MFIRKNCNILSLATFAKTFEELLDYRLSIFRKLFKVNLGANLFSVKLQGRNVNFK